MTRTFRLTGFTEASLVDLRLKAAASEHRAFIPEWRRSPLHPPILDLTLMGLRHHVIDPNQHGRNEGTSILTQPEKGRVLQRPDGKISVLLNEVDGPDTISFAYRVHDGDAPIDCAVTVTVTPSLQPFGWPKGRHFLLPLGPDGRQTVLPGEGFVEVFGSLAPDALTADDIAADAGVSRSSVTGDWLAARLETYGGDAATKLHEDLVQEVVSALGGDRPGVIRLERGPYVYSSRFRKYGLSLVYPWVTSTFGTGERPQLKGGSNNLNALRYWLMQGFDQSADGAALGFRNSGPGLNLEDCNFSRHEQAIIRVAPVTLRHNTYRNAIRYKPANDATNWNGEHKNRKSGLFTDGTVGLVMDGCYMDHAGWAESFAHDKSYNDGANGQPPTYYSHNLYGNSSYWGAMYRGNISTRGPFHGFQLRSGGIVLDNISIEDPKGFLIADNAKIDDKTADWSVSDGNLATQSRNWAVFLGRPLSYEAGAQGVGIDYASDGMTAFDDLAMHADDPADSSDDYNPDKAGLAFKTSSQIYRVDGVSYGWGSKADRNADGLDRTVLDQTTLRLFCDDRYGDPAGTAEGFGDLYAELRSLERWDAVRNDILSWFRQGVEDAGRPGYNDRLARPRTAPATVDFLPQADGATGAQNWVLRKDWSTGDVPGVDVAGDDVRLNGYRIYFGDYGAEIGDLDLGEDGGLIVNAGLFKVTGRLTGTGAGRIGTGYSGALVIAGHDGPDPLDVRIVGGLFVNDGDLHGDVTVSEEEIVAAHDKGSDNTTYATQPGFAVLATPEAVCDCRDLTVGPGCVVGWDGQAADPGPENAGAIAVSRRLSYVAKAGGSPFGRIRERQSGVWGDVAPAVFSELRLVAGATLHLDLTHLDKAGTHRLATADRIVVGDGTDPLTVAATGNAAWDVTVTLETGGPVATLEVTTAPGTGRITIG